MLLKLSAVNLYKKAHRFSLCAWIVNIKGFYNLCLQVDKSSARMKMIFMDKEKIKQITSEVLPEVIKRIIACVLVFVFDFHVRMQICV